ncbi:transmembrane transport [Ascochyta rabiei]|uniref:Transmembrane transport n=1 Tax=Didymella rabiei TaxID=5454 RepID=A0A163G6X4_DIDRA|nr:transmembrane transport [Ascochyta rabiei]
MEITDDTDKKPRTDHVDDVVPAPTMQSKLTVPPLVAAMSQEHRMEAEAKLRKKIDTRLLPMINLMYIMNYLDWNNVAAVRLAGLQDELNLSSVQYQTHGHAAAIESVPELDRKASSLSANLHDRLGHYQWADWCLPELRWPGCISLLPRIHRSSVFPWLPASPFVVVYTQGTWSANGGVYSGSLISGAFGGLITAGVTSNMDGIHGLRAWRCVFVLEGIITVIIGFSAFFVTPNFPRMAKWLSEAKRQLAVYSLQEDIGEDDWTSAEQQMLFHGLKLALMAFCVQFFSFYVKTLGYDIVHTLLLTAPPHVLAVVTTFLNAWHADKTGEQFWHIVLPLYVGVFSFILATATHRTGPRYAAMMLALPGVYTGYVYAQPKSGAQPDLTIALSVDSATARLAIIMTNVMIIVLGRLNKKLEKGEHVEGAINAVPSEAQERGFRFLV